MAKTMFKRGAVVVAAAAMSIGFTAAPAFAANQYLTLSGRGQMTHIDDGDVFRVCDTNADGHGVTGYLRTINTSNEIRTVLTVDDGGDAGCDSKGYDIMFNQPYDMLLCWNGGGGCVVSAVFDE
ncbi:hypothetical protein [Streptomyces sp. NPDC002994]|uniref:hypothetical protein n=1 Tax=Streptomyces sp. NPDC002994 TaxID=3154441 RepID=UPI0033AFA58D